MRNFRYREGIAKLRFGSKSALFVQDPDSAQVAYSQSSMSTCAETGPAQKSSNLASKANFASASKGERFLLCSSSYRAAAPQALDGHSARPLRFKTLWLSSLIGEDIPTKELNAMRDLFEDFQ